jgi:hypothetical protein
MGMRLIWFVYFIFDVGWVSACNSHSQCNAFLAARNFTEPPFSMGDEQTFYTYFDYTYNDDVYYEQVDDGKSLDEPLNGPEAVNVNEQLYCSEMASPKKTMNVCVKCKYCSKVAAGMHDEITTGPVDGKSCEEACSSTSSSQGDPHNRGAHGGVSDFRGRNNTYYNFQSTQNMSTNLLFMVDDYWWRKKKVYGSWMKAVAVTASTKENRILRFLYHVDFPSSITTNMEGNKEVRAGDALEGEGIKVHLTRKLAFYFSNGAWVVEAINRALPYQHLNGKKRRLDITMRPTGDVDQDPIAPHGLLGQTYDRDNKMVIGALDNYDVPSKVIVTKAMGEGAIEGVATDYEMDGPFSTDFKFSRFGATGHVAPRNVSLLSGLVLPAKYGVAGAVNDEVDA